MTEPIVLKIPGQVEHISDGLRVSTDCPCQRLREYVDPTLYPKIPPEYATRGYLAERAFQECYLHDTTWFDQVVVPWDYADSHLDIVVTGGPEHKMGVTEIKCNADAELYDENIRQVQRQMYVVTLAAERGVKMLYDKNGTAVISPEELIAMPWRIQIMHPNKPVLLNPDGYTIRLTDERRAELDAEWALQDEIMQSPAGKLKQNLEFEEAWPECTCGKCWPLTKQAANYKTESAAYRYFEAQQEELYAKKLKEEARDELRKMIPNGEQHVGGGFKVTHGNEGEPKEKIDYTKGFAALGEGASVEDLRSGGYAKMVTSTPQIRVTPIAADKKAGAA